jgi:hypothetical protein
MKYVIAVVAGAVLAASTPAQINHPQWAVRTSYDGANHFIDQPSCHPLAYFLNDTARLNYHHSIIHIEPGRTKDETKSLTIGEAEGWNIVQVTHKIADGALFLRLLLVERHAGEFCEIYHQEYMGVPDEPADLYGVYDKVLPAYLVNVGPETVLAVNDPVSGNGNEYDEHYWTFDKGGPIDLCVLEKIKETEKTLLPKGSTLANGGEFNIEQLTYEAGVRPQNGSTCCGGNIQIQFALRDHRLIVASQNFNPTK